MNKIKIMKANTKSNNVVTVGGKPLEETYCFTYLGSKINKIGDSSGDLAGKLSGYFGARYLAKERIFDSSISIFSALYIT